MSANERSFLIFFLQGQRYALVLADVEEVMSRPMIWPIPFAPRCYSGAINFHGNIVAIIDLAVFLGFAGGGQALEKIIVLDLKGASLGFFVERVARIVQEEELELHDPPDLRFASAMLRLPEGDAILLDAGAIIAQAGVLMRG